MALHLGDTALKRGIPLKPFLTSIGSHSRPVHGSDCILMHLLTPNERTAILTGSQTIAIPKRIGSETVREKMIFPEA